MFLHSLSLVNKYVTLIEPIRNAAHVCHPRINKHSVLFRGWFIASRECPLPTDWSVHWLNWPSLLSCSQQQRRLCFCYRTHKFLNPSFNLRSFRFSEFHSCIGRTDGRIRWSFWIYGLRGSRSWKEFPRMIEIRALEIFYPFLLFILPRIPFWPISTILWLTKVFSKQPLCEQNCVKIGKEQEITLFN